MVKQLSLFDGMLLNPTIEKVFNKLAVPVKPQKMEQLKTDIKRYLERITRAQNKNEFLNEPLARKIGKTAIYLLDSYQQYPKNKQALIIGAVKYFLLDADEENDLESPLGFDDDAEVFNYVLKNIGRDDLIIDIEGVF